MDSDKEIAQTLSELMLYQTALSRTRISLYLHRLVSGATRGGEAGEDSL